MRISDRNFAALIVGASGFVGRRMFALLGSQRSIATYNRRPIEGGVGFDARDGRLIDVLNAMPRRITHVFILYGAIDMEGCARDPAGTAQVNIASVRRMIDDTIEYAGQRKAFGQSILDNQVVHFRLAELKTEVEMLRSLTYRAAELMLKGEDVTMLASMAKLKSGRLAREISDACLQYYGGMGFMNETPISRAYRDTRLGSIGGGADEVMLSIICKHMGILPGKRNK